jgi:hypothetical protein
MIALLAIVMVTAPIASAAIETFTVTPTDYVAGNTSNYTVQLNTSGFNSLNITIPAGLEAVVPTSARLITRVDLYNGTDSANVTFTANSTALSTKVDICVRLSDDDTVYNHTKTVDYSTGTHTNISLGDYTMNLTLPLRFIP